jgi:hypothetical protein
MLEKISGANFYGVNRNTQKRRAKPSMVTKFHN